MTLDLSPRNMTSEDTSYDPLLDRSLLDLSPVEWEELADRAHAELFATVEAITQRARRGAEIPADLEIPEDLWRTVDELLGHACPVPADGACGRAHVTTIVLPAWATEPWVYIDAVLALAFRDGPASARPTGIAGLWRVCWVDEAGQADDDLEPLTIEGPPIGRLTPEA